MSSDLNVYGVAAGTSHGDNSGDRPVRRHGLVTGRPAPALRDYVTGYIGFTKSVRLPAIQRALPSAGVPLLFEFDPSPGLLSFNGREHRIPALPVVGLHDHAVTVHQPGPPHGIAVLLTPPGAYALLGVAMREIANTYTDMVDLLGNQAIEIAERLPAQPGWNSRFALLNKTLAGWLTPERSHAAPAIVRAWQRLAQTHGRLRIDDLASELGVSRSYLNKRFGEQVGLQPKTLARVLRFRRAARLISTSTMRLGPIAEACGYTDQAHLHHEFLALAACTPTQFLTRRTIEPASAARQAR